MLSNCQTIVSRKDNDCIICHTSFIENVHYPTDLDVKVSDHREVLRNMLTNFGGIAWYFFEHFIPSSQIAIIERMQFSEVFREGYFTWLIQIKEHFWHGTGIVGCHEGHVHKEWIRAIISF